MYKQNNQNDKNFQKNIFNYVSYIKLKNSTNVSFFIKYNTLWCINDLEKQNLYYSSYE
jgi:hypothetical protein